MPRPDNASPAPNLREKAGDRIDNYRLLEVIGEGAFGVVWMAEQEAPVRRRLALKIIKLGMDTRAVIARLEAERQALAMMDHPNIAKVYDGGATASGRPYFVMELVRGLPLTEYCDTRQLNTRARLSLFATICEAVQHAHQKGIIHRDLKPSNIIVAEHDERAAPKVIDFGIAKATEQQLTDKTLFTQFNQFIGTPAYMSPEQASLGSLDIDTRSDVYSLGVVLYELVTGRPPFDQRELLKAGFGVIQRTIRETEPPKPSTRLSTLSDAERIQIAERRKELPENLTRIIQGELDWIILKALEKDRNRRYQSANGLASDLRNYLQDKPVSAAPPTWSYQFQKFARRNRVALATTFAFAFVLLAGALISTWQAFRATRLAKGERDARAHEQQALLEAQTNLFRARLNAYASDIKLAQQALAENNQSRAVELLNRNRPAPGETNDLRGFEWRYLWQLSRPNELASFPDGVSHAVAFSPDGALFAHGAGDGVIIRDVATQQVITNLTKWVASMCFSPKEKLLAVSNGGSNLSTSDGVTGEVTLWDTSTWKMVRSLPRAAQPVCFSPDGKWLATGATNGPNENPKFLLWRTDSWEQVASGPATSEMSSQLKNVFGFSPDNTRLITLWLKTEDEKCGLNIWKVPSLELADTFFVDSYPVCSAAFSPDGTNLLIGTWFGELAVWNTQTRTVVQVEKENNSGITSIATAPGASIFATTSHDHRVILWEIKTRKVLARFRGHVNTIWASALSPDGSLVASGTFAGVTKLWNGNARDASSNLKYGPLVAGFSRDSKTLILAPRAGDFRWHLTGAAHSTVEIPAEPSIEWGTTYVYRPYDVFGDPPVGVLGRSDGTIQIWNLATGQQTYSWSASTNSVTAASFSPDGAQLATGDKRGQVRVWDIASQQPLASFHFSGKSANPVSKVVFSPDGKSIAAACWPGWPARVTLWDVATGEAHELEGGADGANTTIAFSPDGRLIASGAMGPSDVFLWDLPSGKPHKPLRGHVTGIVQVEFSPDGKTLATGGYDTIKLWNVATEQEVAEFPMKGIFREFHFSPDGRTFAAAYYGYPGHFVRLYQAPSFEEIEVAERTEP